jgi:hypothetical protein
VRGTETLAPGDAERAANGVESTIARLDERGPWTCGARATGSMRDATDGDAAEPLKDGLNRAAGAVATASGSM